MFLLFYLMWTFIFNENFDMEFFKYYYKGCKVVIYNYILCWLYSMTKSVVIVLILFLVFCEILLYWV